MRALDIVREVQDDATVVGCDATCQVICERLVEAFAPSGPWDAT